MTKQTLLILSLAFCLFLLASVPGYAQVSTAWGFSIQGDPLTEPAPCRFSAVVANVTFDFNCVIRLPRATNPVWHNFPQRKPAGMVILPGWGGTAQGLGGILNNFAEGIGGHPAMVAIAIDLTHSFTGGSPGGSNDLPTSSSNLARALVAHGILNALEIVDPKQVALLGYSRGSITAGGIAGLPFNPYAAVLQQSGGMGLGWQLTRSEVLLIRGPFFMYNCDADPVALIANANAEFQEIKNRPLVQMRTYAGCNHVYLFSSLEHFQHIGQDLQAAGFFR